MEYNVEKILEKRIRNGEVSFSLKSLRFLANKNIFKYYLLYNLLFFICQAEYYIKWEKYSKRFNTWKPRANLTKCQNELDNFELKWARDIVGMTGTDVLLRFKCGEVRQITVTEAKSKWPNLVNSFCKKNPGFSVFFKNNVNDTSATNKKTNRRKNQNAVTSDEDSKSGKQNERIEFF